MGMFEASSEDLVSEDAPFLRVSDGEPSGGEDVFEDAFEFTHGDLMRMLWNGGSNV